MWLRTLSQYSVFIPFFLAVFIPFFLASPQSLTFLLPPFSLPENPASLKAISSLLANGSNTHSAWKNCSTAPLKLFNTRGMLQLTSSTIILCPWMVPRHSHDPLSSSLKSLLTVAMSALTLPPLFTTPASPPQVISPVLCHCCFCSTYPTLRSCVCVCLFILKYLLFGVSNTCIIVPWRQWLWLLFCSWINSRELKL